MTAIIERRVRIITESTEWKGGYVDINSFGFGGANNHLLLKSNSKIKVNETNNNLPKRVVTSGRTKEAVKIILDDNDNISVKEISSGHIPFHSRYIEPVRIKLLEYLNQILPQKASPSSK
ncbi:Fatty acid synthase [Camponotus floridanus]|uniref:Fatty acid synthase n=1 Tax=Camponotus floridanus TaxID=104421 RepID=E2AGC6_CAMFO|nr:Fatty acid synthase [Camponotus floridanus]